MDLERLRMVGAGLMVDRILGTRVLVKTIEPYTLQDKVQEKGLLHIPESAKATPADKLPSTGMVVMLGDAVDEDTPLKLGDIVMFNKHAGSQWSIDEVDFRVLDYWKEVLGVLVAKDGPAYVKVEGE